MKSKEENSRNQIQNNCLQIIKNTQGAILKTVGCNLPVYSATR